MSAPRFHFMAVPLFVGLAVLAQSGCGTRGERSIHVPRSFESEVTMIPARLTPGPPVRSARALARGRIDHSSRWTRFGSRTH